MFKIGDRVRVINDEGDGVIRRLKGKEGKVIDAKGNEDGIVKVEEKKLNEL